MKNLRKVLAVVLVVCMVFSLATIASALTFTDDSSIQYKEAVGVMTGIGAINGYPDGSFGPTNNVTRAEAAKMIVYAILGPTVAASLSTSTSSFSDVAASHWASPYIEYCVDNGIINGRGDGTFDPTGNVTGFELAKMMLCADGYGKDNEYVGSNWALNVAIDAFDNDIFNGNDDGNFSVAATREEAALYIYNGLMVERVTYSKVTGEYTGTGSDMLESKYDMEPDTGMVMANQATGDDFTVVDIAGVEKDCDVTTGLSLIGHDVTVFYADANEDGNIDDDETIYYVLDNSTTWAAEEDDDLPDDVTYDAVVPMFEDYTNTGDTPDTTIDEGTYIITDDAVTAYLAPSTFAVDLVVDIDDTEDAETIELDGAGVLENNDTLDEVIEYAGIAVDDIVIVTYTGTLFTLTKATTVEGTISKVTADDTITLGGVAYAETDAVTNDSGIVDDAINFDDTFTLYLDGFGGYFGVEAVDAASDAGLLYVTLAYTVETTDAYGNPTTSYYVQGVTTTGTEANYQVTVATYTEINNGDGDNDELMLFSVETAVAEDAGNGGLEANYATLTAEGTVIPWTDDNANTTWDSGETDTVAADAVKIEDDNYYASDVAFIYVDGSGATLDVTVLNEVQAIENTNTGYYYAEQIGDTTNNSVMYVFIDGEAPAAESDGLGLIFVNDLVKDADTADGDVFEVYLDGVETEITLANGTTPAAVGFYTYTETDGVTTLTAYTGDDVVGETLDNLVGDLITTASADDVDATGATVVDLTDDDVDLADIEDDADYMVSFAIDDDGVTAVIYIELAP
ncbi:S-layer homology domain-containing protein [Oscillospiraceae bacterium CM]|nr:S-layer homology domain-containing protein [Oscillospiraceae bacterium CM]